MAASETQRDRYHSRNRDYRESRRSKRDKIIENGVKKVWAHSPKNPYSHLQDLEKQEYFAKMNDPSLAPKIKSAMNEKLLKGNKDPLEAHIIHDEDWIESSNVELMIGPQPLLSSFIPKDYVSRSHGKDNAKSDFDAAKDFVGHGKRAIKPEVPREHVPHRESHKYYYDEKRATLLEKQEERAKRENKILSDFRELIHRQKEQKRNL